MDKDKRDAIHTVLTQLESEGNLAPDILIERARDPDSPLHGEFTWDVEQAAMMTWRSQARALISQFRITITVNRTEYRIQEFVEAPGKAEREQGYVAFTKIKNSKDLAREFLDRELGIAETHVSKARDYARVLGLEGRAARVVKDITLLRAAAHKQTGARNAKEQAAVH